MFSIVGPERRGAVGRVSRRELLRVGGLSWLGLSATQLRRLRAEGDAKRRGNSCVFLFLFGGPSHIDLWDMKPKAPEEIRGDFRPIATRVEGMHICEHLPRLAARADKFSLIRSMTHAMPVHGPACSELYTGRPYFGPPTTDQAKPEDWPSVASMVTRYGARSGGVPPSVVLPWYSQFDGQDDPIAGQVGGRMGAQYRPFLIAGDPSQPDFVVPGLRLPGDVSLQRAEARRSLLDRLETNRDMDRQGSTFREQYETAFRMLDDERIAEALELRREADTVRAEYGGSKIAQSLLLARRLVEAGVPLVTVNWDDESRAAKVSPFWDTHDQNFPTLRNRLAPRFDQAFAAFLDDLDRRGLLETTLVVATGEFGRTPKIGQFTQNAMTEKTGRDHWPHAFTTVVAGGRLGGGNVHGATNETGGYVKDRPVSPSDLSATILDHLGIDPGITYWDEFQQVERRLSEGRPLRSLE